MKQDRKEKGNFPILRFPDFQGEWEEKKVSDILEFFPTNSLSWEQLEYSERELYNLHYGLIHKGLPTQIDLALCALPSIKESNIPNNYTICRNGDVAFADASEDTNDVAKVVEFLDCNEKKIICGLHTIHGRDKLELTVTGFKGYIFSSTFFRNQIRKIAQGTKIYSISTKNFSECYVNIPPKEEQMKIANLLLLIDERISTQIKIIEELRLLKCVLLKKTFFQELRFPEFNKNWKTVRLGDVGTFFSGGTPLTSMKLYYNGDIPFIKSGEINADCTEQFISEEGLKNSSAKMIEIGDLIYALYGATSGEVGISKIKGAINQAVLCIRTKLNSIFLLNYLMFKKDEILRTYLQGGQGNLSAEIIKSLKISVPINAEQTKLAYLFSAFDRKVELEMNIMAKLKQQKQYLLQQMFI